MGVTMIVMIKSAPDTPEAKRGITLARDLIADIVLIQDAVNLARLVQDGGISRAVYALDEDLRMRGREPDADIGEIRRIDYDELVDLITKADSVYGAF
jgi:sulfur relay protein TusB/DsrH